MIVYPVSQEESGGMINLVVFHTQPELEDALYDGPWSAQGQCLGLDWLEGWEPEAKAWFMVRRPSRSMYHAHISPAVVHGESHKMGDTCCKTAAYIRQ